LNFGDSDYVDLNKGLGGNNGIAHHEDVGNTSPGVIYKDLIITGSAVGEDYMVDGRQYVVIAAGGGGRQRTKAGDYYIAFALPED